MMFGRRVFLRPILLAAGLAFGLFCAQNVLDFSFSTDVHAARTPKERRKNAPVPPKEAAPGPVVPPIEVPAQTPAPSAPVIAVEPPPPELKEAVEADVSARSIAVTFGFTGTEIVVFGSVDNSRQPSAEAGYYDVVVIVEGAPSSIVTRRKSNVAGLWMNTASLTFDRVPSYYAIASTRPFDEIADAVLLAEHGIGFQHIKMRPRMGRVPTLPDEELAGYRDALVRLKQKDGLYVKEDYDVTFIGRSLFRASAELPANIPVGPLDTRVYLFREGKLLSKYNSRVMLEREGAERWLHAFANERPALYGMLAVAIALSAGLAASAVFRRGLH